VSCDCSGDMDDSAAAAGALGYDYDTDDVKGAKYSPHYSAGGKGSSTDVFV